MCKMSLEKSKQVSASHHHPLMQLPREDLDLITELVLQSGSLKGLAKAVGVSYPTIRLRLDKVIKRLEAVLAGRKPDPVRELLAQLIERGELPAHTARRILETCETHYQNHTPPPALTSTDKEISDE